MLLYLESQGAAGYVTRETCGSGSERSQNFWPDPNSIPFKHRKNNAKIQNVASQVSQTETFTWMY
jgi:hypothetical protein